jgi:hypothetical protein
MTPNSDPDVLRYILNVFPPELEQLDELAVVLRERNGQLRNETPIDVEPVLVTALWMRRVLQHARQGELDVQGIFEISACLAHEMPKVQAHREAELRGNLGEFEAEIEK